MKKKFFGLVLFSVLLSFWAFSQNAVFTEYSFEAEVLMKENNPNPTKLAWRNILYAPNYVVEGSDNEYLLKSTNIKKGYSSFSLYQENGKPFSVVTNGKEQKFVPGKLFSKDAGLIWISFTAPDKKKYSLPTDIKIISQEEFEEIRISEKQRKTETENGNAFTSESNTIEESEKESEMVEDTEAREETEVSDFDFSEIFTAQTDSYDEDEADTESDFDESRPVYTFVRDSRNFPQRDQFGTGTEIGEFAGLNKQMAEENTNVQVIVKNLPDGTKPKIFMMNGLEVLVYIAPDLSLRAEDNCYSLFYSFRRYGRDEDVAAPKRIVENPKINGKLTNMLDFDGIVTNVQGKQKLILVWTQCAVQVEGNISEEELFKKTAVYWSSWKENDKSWEKVECISELKGSLQFNPVLSAGENGLCLKIRNRPDNKLFSDNDNPAFAEKSLYFILNKKGLWETTGSADFSVMKDLFEISDSNNQIPDSFEFSVNREGGVAGCFWADGPSLFVKTYIKSPDTKKMIWTESVPVLYQNKKKEGTVLYPHAAVRDTGDWIFTYLLKTETGFNLCVSKVNNEPCMVTRNLIPDLKDMQHPGNTVHFTVQVENLGIGLASGMDVVIKNEFKTEAGVVSYKDNFYPGTVYQLSGIYQKLKGKDGVVPVEEIYADVKFPKMKKNSDFAYYDAHFTMGIPKLSFGDIFVMTKGKNQKVIFTLGTSNGIKVKAPATELIITEHIDNPEYEDNTSVVAVDSSFSDSYYEMSYEYETAEFDEKSFDFNVLFHYEENKRKFPGWNSDDVEKETATEISCSVNNPVYIKPSYYSTVLNTSFVKKTKIMTADFVVSNNWPEVISETVSLSLVNNVSGVTEQTVDIPFDLDILQNKKITVSFEPAESENASDYSVMIQK